jgi:NAD(P)-dependent dehydrogenase (short-subunit alcohol dehydrogenase family)
LFNFYKTQQIMNAFTTAVVVITGAASGIGRALALQAASRGADVIATDINAVSLEETKGMAFQEGRSITTEVLDVSDAKAIEQFSLRWIPQLNGRKLVLINNAGVALLSGSFEHTSLADFEWLVRINLWGAIYLTKAFYPYLLEQNAGHIVNISSVFGLVGIEHQAAYCTAKFALRGFTETLRMELTDTNIYTTTVHPGGVDTNIVRNSRLNERIASKETHQTSITRFAKLAITTSDSAARQILNAVEKKQARLVIGKDGRTLDLLARLLPVGYTALVKKRLEKTFGNPYMSS